LVILPLGFLFKTFDLFQFGVQCLTSRELVFKCYSFLQIFQVFFQPRVCSRQSDEVFNFPPSMEVAIRSPPPPPPRPCISILRCRDVNTYLKRLGPLVSLLQQLPPASASVLKELAIVQGMVRGNPRSNPNPRGVSIYYLMIFLGHVFFFFFLFFSAMPDLRASAPLFLRPPAPQANSVFHSSAV